MLLDLIAKQFLPAVDDPIVLTPGGEYIDRLEVVVRTPTTVIIKAPSGWSNEQPNEYFKIEVTEL